MSPGDDTRACCPSQYLSGRAVKAVCQDRQLDSCNGSDGFHCHVSGFLDRASVVPLKEDSNDQPCDGVLFGDDADGIDELNCLISPLRPCRVHGLGVRGRKPSQSHGMDSQGTWEVPFPPAGKSAGRGLPARPTRTPVRRWACTAPRELVEPMAMLEQPPITWEAEAMDATAYRKRRTE